MLAEQVISLSAGVRRYALSLSADEAGVQELDAVLDLDGDRRAGNNRAHAVVQVVGAPRVLVYNERAAQTALVRALATSGLELDVRGPGTPLTLAALQDTAALVLENVALSDLGDGADSAVAAYVDHMGGGLLITGGRNSYALGGYFHSQLDEQLPVAMDRQQELRRPRLDMAIALDRSGSMTVLAQNGLPKMDLANRAAAEAIALLAPGDGVSVLAVDTAAHEVVPLQTISSQASRASIVERVKRIESSGGGIYVYTALAASMDSLLAGHAATRHIVLFADAADSEEPGDYRTLLRRWRQAGGTISVIGLGTPDDVDAALLRNIAELGGGQAYFTSDALQLPRVFAQDVMYVARKTFLEASTPVLPGRGLLSFGLADQAIPETGGYNLTFLREGAEAMLVTGDENHAALAAGWQHGAGRVLAVTFEADGPYTGALAGWKDYKPFFRAGLEWVKRSAVTDLDADIAVTGRFATLRVTLPPGHTAPAPSQAWLLSTPDGEGRPIALHWTGPSSLAARFPLESGKLYQAVLESRGSPLVAPPVTLPYSPELALQSGDEGGDAVLSELAQATGGSEFVSVADLSRARPAPLHARQSLVAQLASALLALLLLDIAQRRGLLDARLAKLRAALRGVGMRLRRVTAKRASTVSAGEEAPQETTEAQLQESPTPPTIAAGPEDPLVLAKRRARRR